MSKNKLEFGTAGIRGILGPGEENLNIGHVARIADGFARYLLEKYPNIKARGIVIGRDNRKLSSTFAQVCAAIFDSYEIKVYFHKDIAPTPFISYTIRYHGACGGINITASHNPKEYNGVKLYDYTGCQILPEETNELLEFFHDYATYSDFKYKFKVGENIEYISGDDSKKYLKEVLKIGNEEQKDLSNIKIAYSPQHGTGAKICKKIFDELKVNAFYEEREMIEDENFTFVKNPNPEDPSAYKNVAKIASKNDCDLILITDPDSDRVGAAVKNKEKSFQILTGNETAILIMDYLIAQNKEKIKKEQFYIVYSFVSSSLPAKMAAENNIKAYKVATGFKWIGNLIKEKENSYEKFLFGFEESYGSLIDEDLSRDKDAIQSIVILSKMVSYYKNNNLTLLDVLDQIYQKYGYVKSKTISLKLKDKKHLAQLKEIFSKINFEDSLFTDYQNGVDQIAPSDMLSYEFQNNSWISLRPSGTEPKVKIYLFFIKKTQEEVNQVFEKNLNILKEKLEIL
ncbi:MAG: phospho-sugar mutase [Metamycoplasmataceae bacterium]